MDVILDTNILYDNFFLDTPKFQALFSYLSKTKSRLVLPRIVLFELEKKYLERLNSHLSLIEKDDRILKTSLLREQDDLSKTMLEKYRGSLNRLVELRKIYILEHESVDIEISALVGRSLDEKLPFNNNDRGFRDVIIWESIKKFLVEKKESVSLISNDKSAFGGESLDTSLINEIGLQGKNLFFYNQLELFLKDYGEKIDFINKGMIQSYLNIIGESVADTYDSSDFDRFDLFHLRSYDDFSIDDVSYNEVRLIDFYIYKSTKDNYHVLANAELSFDLDLTFETYDSEDGPGRWHETEDVTRDIDIELVIDKKSKEIIRHSAF